MKFSIPSGLTHKVQVHEGHFTKKIITFKEKLPELSHNKIPDSLLLLKTKMHAYINRPVPCTGSYASLQIGRAHV